MQWKNAMENLQSNSVNHRLSLCHHKICLGVGKITRENDACVDALQVGHIRQSLSAMQSTAC